MVLGQKAYWFEPKKGMKPLQTLISQLKTSWLGNDVKLYYFITESKWNVLSWPSLSFELVSSFI